MDCRCKGCPGLCLHTKFTHKINAFTLLLEWIYFNLVYGRLDLVDSGNIHQPVWLKIANTDSAQFPATVGILHRTPRAVHVTVWLVNQVQVEVVQLQALKGVVDSLLAKLIAGVLYPQFCGYK